MNSVPVSPKYQIVIPKEIRDKYRISPGERLIMIPYEGRIELVPERDMKSMRGFLKGMDTTIERENDRV